ncbi:nucleotide sugar dehydrogenase [Geopyxis carbonaria]|nr:nucleotide sugar dehydrogenase [Geopyxis carbonaria]
MDKLRSLVQCLIPTRPKRTAKPKPTRTPSWTSSASAVNEKASPTIQATTVQSSVTTFSKPTPFSDDAIRTLVSTPCPSTPLLAPVSPAEPPLVAVIGVGYVGTHLVASFAPHYNLIAFDISAAQLQRVAPTIAKHREIRWTTDAADLAAATHFLIAVPTSLREDKQVDLSFLEAALETVRARARPGATVVVESSVSVGMTRRLLTPLVESRGLLGGMSPERVDPGRVSPAMEEIPKIISGLTPASLSAITALYSRVFHTVVPVSQPEVAEMMKLYENCQRMVCIAYANEMADACAAHGIDAFEVARAAATKPFGFLPFTPGLGVGGPCIPVNPYYLLANNEMPLLRQATEAMWARPAAVGRRALAAGGKTERVLVVGAGFKKGQAVTQHSPSVELMRAMQAEGAEVWFCDPLVAQERLADVRRLDETREWTRRELERFGLVVVAFQPDGVDMGLLSELRGVRVEMWCQ